MEKLIPFDFEEFKKDPMRVRHNTSTKAIWAEAVHGAVAVKWENGGATVYERDDFRFIRLAAKTRKVGVRVWVDHDGLAGSHCDDRFSLNTDRTVGGNRWVSDIIEVEIQE